MATDDSNLPNEVLAQHDPNNPLLKALAEANAKIAELQAENTNIVAGRVGITPRYLLNEPCFLDNVLFPAGTELDWTGEPNLDMVPLNDPAVRAMEVLIERLEEGGRRQAAQAGREFFGLVNERGMILDLANRDAKYTAAMKGREAVMPEARIEPVPTMTHTEEARVMEQRRGRGRPRGVSNVTAPKPVAPPTNSVPTMMPPSTVRGVEQPAVRGPASATG